MSNFVIVSFCNNPDFTTSPVLCVKLRSRNDETISYAPVNLGFPGLIHHVTGLTLTDNLILTAFSSEGKFYVAGLNRKDLAPLFYQELPGTKDVHSILAVNDQLYVVSTGTDEVLCYDLKEQSIENSRILWRASDTKSDTHHINSIAEKDGEILISAFGPKTGQFWSTALNGYILNITTNSLIMDGIYHPHSLSVKNGRIYYSDSHRNTFCVVDQTNAIFNLPGYTRGASWLTDNLVCIATSIGRRISKSTGLIANPADPGEPSGECGILIGDVVEKRIIKKMDLSWFGPEIYDVLVLNAVEIDLLALSNLSQIAERRAMQVLFRQLDEGKQRLTEINQQVQELSTQLDEGEQRLTEINQQVREFSTQLAKKEQELLEIYRSKAWRLAMLLRRIRIRLIPPESRREGFVYLIKRTGWTFRNEGLRPFFRKIVNKLRHIVRRVKASAVSMISSPKIGRGPKNGNARQEEIYVPISGNDVDPRDVKAKVIAFYLPQFHPIPENDAWWGKGFTEWINVSKAAPNFVGHYQPHVPGELGYYDLRLPQVQEQQIALAKKYGIYGFCFYYYWFHGKRLLERPINQYLANPRLDLPFCLCWANENWTRRWDGAEHDILIAQEYNEEQYEHFIRDISIHFSDPRYIRVDGKPLLLVYRVNLLPDAKKTAEIWRSECRKMGIGEIYLAAVQSFGTTDPRPYGFDAAVEFPPSNLGEAEISRRSVKITNPNFGGHIFDYNIVVRSMLNKKHGDYTVFKTVMPSWDNTARKQNDAHIFINSSPAAYQEWLEKVVEYSQRTLPEDKRFVFVNAWNEWAEGTHLEPDRRYGYAYLQATANAITKKKSASTWTILFVSHDANKGGAQDVLINAVGWFKQHTNINVKVLCLQGGDWLHRFMEITDTLVLDGTASQDDEEEILRQVEQFCEGAPDLIYGNTVAAGSAYKWLRKLGAPILTHFHELESSIRKYGAPWIKDVISISSHFIACSEPVRENLIRNHGVPAETVSTVYESIVSRQSKILDKKSKLRQRKKLGLKQDVTLIFGCGIGMPFRKGADLFIQLGETLLQKGHKDFHLYWIGEFDPAYHDEEYGAWESHYVRLKKRDLGRHVTFLGMKDDPREYLVCGDIFLLPSREDPFPLVALEAADCGLPILCFAESGGMADFVGKDAGFAVPRGDLDAMAEKIIELDKHEELRVALGERGREKLLSGFTTERTTPHILSVCRKVANKKPAVSVIVPNYNHEPYLKERLDSIFNQSFRDFEVILLDDASTDNSVDVLMKYARHADVRIVPGEINSGSPFRQWLRGIDMAESDILWIAESDDTCDPDLLKTLLPAFNNPKVKLAYVNSNIIDENGLIIGDYIRTEYLSSLSTTKWNGDYQATAEEEINDGLGVKNTILNISAVLIRRFEMSEEFRDTLQNMRIAGDWYFIVNAIKDGLVIYNAKKLNFHRRHSSSVIARTVNDQKLHDFFREFFVVQDYIVKTYPLRRGFSDKWETYLIKQWNDWNKDRPVDELSRYYPFEQMRLAVKKNIEAQNGRE